MWRTKPLLRRDGDKVFKTGGEAVQLLVGEANRRDGGHSTFINAWSSMVTSLGVLFDRQPKYAWVMKQLLEPERSITFRVAWIDDAGVSRVNRGFRIQYSSALGPYEGGTAFSNRVSMSTMKAAAFDATFTNALGTELGGAFGGADFNPYTKSDTELQRFCQSYMTELSKYIAPDVDLPGMSEGVNVSEIGYLYGQYKRINEHSGQQGRGLLWGGNPKAYMGAHGYGVVSFAKLMLKDKNISLEGKRCLVIGSNYVALAVAEELIANGAIPITLSDSTGHVYEPQGFDSAKLKTLQKIKADRGARVGRYIIASTSAKFNEPESVYDIKCDYVFHCTFQQQMSDYDVNRLATNGCQGIIEGVNQSLSTDAIVAAKKKGMIIGPYRATTIGSSLVNGHSLNAYSTTDKITTIIDKRTEEIYDEIKSTAKEFNTRGDLHAGTNIASFLRVADAMLAHGSV